MKKFRSGPLPLVLQYIYNIIIIINIFSVPKKYWNLFSVLFTALYHLNYYLKFTKKLNYPEKIQKIFSTKR